MIVKRGLSRIVCVWEFEILKLRFFFGRTEKKKNNRKTRHFNRRLVIKAKKKGIIGHPFIHSFIRTSIQAGMTTINYVDLPNTILDLERDCEDESDEDLVVYILPDSKIVTFKIPFNNNLIDDINAFTITLTLYNNSDNTSHTFIVDKFDNCQDVKINGNNTLVISKFKGLQQPNVLDRSKPSSEYSIQMILAPKESLANLQTYRSRTPTFIFRSTRTARRKRRRTGTSRSNPVSPIVNVLQQSSQQIVEQPPFMLGNVHINALLQQQPEIPLFLDNIITLGNNCLCSISELFRNLTERFESSQEYDRRMFIPVTLANNKQHLAATTKETTGETLLHAFINIVIQSPSISSKWSQEEITNVVNILLEAGFKSTDLYKTRNNLNILCDPAPFSQTNNTNNNQTPTSHHLHVAKLLHASDPNTFVQTSLRNRDKSGRLPFLSALFHGFHDLCDYFLELDPSLMKSLNASKSNVLHVAVSAQTVSKWNIEFVQRALEYHPELLNARAMIAKAERLPIDMLNYKKRKCKDDDERDICEQLERILLDAGEEGG